MARQGGAEPQTHRVEEIRSEERLNGGRGPARIRQAAVADAQTAARCPQREPTQMRLAQGWVAPNPGATARRVASLGREHRSSRTGSRGRGQWRWPFAQSTSKPARWPRAGVRRSCTHDAARVPNRVPLIAPGPGACSRWLLPRSRIPSRQARRLPSRARARPKRPPNQLSAAAFRLSPQQLPRTPAALISQLSG